MKLLVTTFDALLLVQLGADGRGPAKVERISDDHPIYFGISRAGRIAYVVARNLSSQRKILDPSAATNMIEEWDIGRRRVVCRWTHPLMYDLHQIRVRGRHLFVLSGRSPSLLIFDRKRRSLVRTVDINALVPEHLRHEPPAQHPHDRYHLNSLTFTPDGRMLILAHNWEFGSFVLEFDVPPLGVLLGGWKLKQVHEDRGFEAHDILVDGADQFVVSSKQNALLRNGVRSVTFDKPGFPRGLAATKKRLFITSGVGSAKREGRSSNATNLLIVDRETQQVTGEHYLGEYGNASDLTLLDASDLTDFDPLKGRPRWQRGLDRLAAWAARRTAVRQVGDRGEVLRTTTVWSPPRKLASKPQTKSRPKEASYDILLDDGPLTARQGELLTVRGTIVNKGEALPTLWDGQHQLEMGAEVRAGDDGRNAVAARVRIERPDGIPAQGSVPFSIGIDTSQLPTGQSTIHFDVLYERLLWLGTIGGTPVEASLSVQPSMSFDSVDESCPVTDARFWQQHVPDYNPVSKMGIRSPSFQDYEITTSQGIVTARSMLTQYELALLYSLTKYHWQGRGHIVDLGPLLGLGTFALADGLAQNKLERGKWHIYSYDLFLLEYMDHFLPASDAGETGSVFNRFLEINRDNLDVVVPVPGDVLKMNWTGTPIEILFIDLAKSWPLNRHVIDNFFPHLIPGHSIVIQQDYVHAGEPWVAATMELFDEYFERLYFVYGASAVYRLIKPIPPEVLSRELRKSPIVDDLFEQARTKATPAIAQVLKCCQAAVRVEHGDLAGAEALLDSVDRNARDGAGPSQEFHPAIPASLMAVRRSIQAARARLLQ